MENHIRYFKDIILYKGEFYFHKPETVYLHNRMDITYTLKNISILPTNVYEDTIEYDKIAIFICGFQSNMGHLLWDFMYPSWYSLFFSDEKVWNTNFQWITIDKLFKDSDNGTSWHKDILEKFSGNEITTPKILSSKYTKPLKIKLLITGIKNLGIGCVQENICVNTSFSNHIMDPVETFINRFYLRYGINRNKYDDNNITNVIYIHNKRPYNGIIGLFDKLNQKYKDNYNFRYIDWSKHTFEEQLEILNTTRIIICGVGTARTNTPFIPNGSIEIQTNHINGAMPNNISFFDCHIGTISNFVKVFNINSYTEYESKENLLSTDLIHLIEKSLKIIPYKNNFNIEENLPNYINKIKTKFTKQMFKNWRDSFSNNIEDITKCLT